MTRKEKLLSLIKNGPPMKADELALIMAVPEKSRGRFDKLVAEIEAEGLAVADKRGRLVSAEKLGLVKGTLRVSPRGFGFVVRTDSTGGDIRVRHYESGGAMNGDEVLVRLLPARAGREEGEIASVLSRGVTELVGTLRCYGGINIVEPDDERLPREVFIPAKGLKGSDGMKVFVKITEYLSDGGLRGRVEEVLGYPNDFGVDVLSIIKTYGFSTEFPKRALGEAAKAPECPSPADLEGRLDLRDKLIITIDGDDSKDLDDAVSLEKKPFGYRLGVHIADVSHYVLPGSALDREAYKRGTSVYLVDRVLPMLPPRLSNGICSLNEGEDRLALSVIMDMDGRGNILNSEFHKSVIKSSHRMTYNNVWKLITGGDTDLAARYADVLPMIRDMYSLSLELRERAAERGYVELDIPEAKAVLDKDGRAVDIALRPVNGANELIEQFMVSANMAVARLLCKKGCPAVFRVHDNPSEEKMAALRKFAASLGCDTRLPLRELVNSVEGPEKSVISAMVLRSMAKAIYSPSNSGHYGLGAEYYCHFTSPIRRYPDLICHRALKALLDGDKAAQKRIGSTNAAAAEACSERETAAEHCERDALDMKKAEYMEQFVGQDFDGVISSVTSFGFFVELPNTVEGLVSVNSLEDDYYVYDDAALTLRGERLHCEYKIGDSVRVTLAAANKQARRIEFVIKSESKARPERSGSNGGTGAKRHKNPRPKQKRVSRVLHRRKNRSRH